MSNKILDSFQIINDDYFLEFMSPNNHDLLLIKKILKNKINISGFHENFQCVKQIGKGNFAKVTYLVKCIN